MRFIVEFELEHHHISDAFAMNAIYERKNVLQSDLGDKIAELFGWKGIGEAKVKEIGTELKEKHTLEIEAFPMGKWVEFKKKLFTHFQLQEINPVKTFEMIKELESFGK